MLFTTATDTSNTIRTQTDAGRTPLQRSGFLIRVIMCFTIAFNYRSLYDTEKDAVLTCDQKPTRVRLIYSNEPTTNKKLSYRRVTARCVVSVEILHIATLQCRNYLYDKSRTKYQLSLIDPCDKIVL